MKTKPIIFFCVFLFTASWVIGQETQRYTNKKGDSHLCGYFPIEVLQTDSVYGKWFKKHYDAFNLPKGKYTWKKKLKDVTIDIYLGTWCGDSKFWVPRFIKLWDGLGLNKNQLNFIALYGGQEKYKQGPEEEEKGKNIHRVPTFIFKRNGKEFARVVESPNNDLTTDIAQIALGYPSEPNYRAATYMMNLLEQKSKEEIEENKEKYIKEAHRKVSRTSELNTLGYVYLYSGRIDEALVVFEFNIHFFKYNPNVYNSYAEALTQAGEIQKAIENYEKVITLDGENKHAKEQIEILKEQLSSGKED